MRTGITAGRVGPFDSVVLESDALRAVVLPALGGRVWELLDKVRGRQWIWNRGVDQLREQPVGANYDEVWAGGWEELFPNDAPGPFEGRELPDHGEWWARRWDVSGLAEDAGPMLRLTASMTVVKASCTKEFRLLDDGATLDVRYAVRSEEPQPFHFLFKQHLPIQLASDCLLQLPGGRARCVDPSFGTNVTNPAEFAWPHAPANGRLIDLRRIPAGSSRQQEFLYLRDLPQPWCGVDDPGCGASLRMRFDASHLPYLWLFLSYGGWRGHYTAVLEPCSNCPKDLAEAARLGQSARLAPGEEFATRVAVRLSPLLPNPLDAPHNEKLPSVASGEAR